MKIQHLFLIFSPIFNIKKRKFNTNYEINLSNMILYFQAQLLLILTYGVITKIKNYLVTHMIILQEEEDKKSLYRLLKMAPFIYLKQTC